MKQQCDISQCTEKQKQFSFCVQQLNQPVKTFILTKKKKKNLNLHQPVLLDIYVEKTYGVQ